MPRGPRDDAPGVAHHVMVRGIERRRIFLDDADREDLLSRLSCLIPALGFRCFAWAFMPNHVHLVLRSANVGVSHLMARLGTGYASHFNRRHDRVGHLFQNRFRSRRAVDDTDLMGLVLYVCRNPLEAGLVGNPIDLESFPWCGLGALVGVRPPHAFEAVNETLGLFDENLEGARRRVRSWLGAPSPTEPLAAPASALDARAPASGRTSAGALDELVREVCAAFGVTVEGLRSRGRSAQLVEARVALAVRATSELGTSGAEVARILDVTRAGVSWMLDRARTKRPASNLTT